MKKIISKDFCCEIFSSFSNLRDKRLEFFLSCVRNRFFFWGCLRLYVEPPRTLFVYSHTHISNFFKPMSKLCPFLNLTFGDLKTFNIFSYFYSHFYKHCYILYFIVYASVSQPKSVRDPVFTTFFTVTCFLPKYSRDPFLPEPTIFG
jgi:hypothetical protein